jgi:hypothetical protein
MMPRSRLLLAALSITAAACSSSPNGTTAADGGGSTVDGGGSPVDGGGSPVDGGGSTMDGGGSTVDGGDAGAPATPILNSLNTIATIGSTIDPMSAISTTVRIPLTAGPLPTPRVKEPPSSDCIHWRARTAMAECRITLRNRQACSDAVL